MQGDCLRLKDGAELAWREAGHGIPLLFIHGWSLDGSVFEPQIEALRERYRVICPDLRGHGRSSPDPEATIDDLAGDVAALADYLHLKDVIAVGWSLGAMVLWEALSARRLGGVAGLVTIDMSPMIHNDDDWQLGLAGGRDHETASSSASAMRTHWPKMVGQFVPRIFSPDFVAANPGMVERLAGIAAQGDVPSLASIWRSMVDQDFREQLATINVPTLVTYGAKSQLYSPQTAHYVASRIPVSDMSEFTLSGHSPHIEEPARFNQILEVFARGVIGQKDRMPTIAIK